MHTYNLFNYTHIEAAHEEEERKLLRKWERKVKKNRDQSGKRGDLGDRMNGNIFFFLNLDFPVGLKQF